MAKTPVKKLSINQLQDVKDRLVALGISAEKGVKAPSVLVPFGPQAFFPGQLDLAKGFHVHTNDNDVTNSPAGEPPLALSREEAMAHIRDEIAALQPPRKNAIPPVTTPTPPSKATPQQPNTTPFVEIREEVDDSGEVTKSQTVDVTKHLEHLELDDDELTVEASNATPAAATEDSKLEYWEPSPPPRGASEDEHAAMMQRFEDLAKLEENTERNERENKSSARRLQSKGWKKGFLSSKPSKKKTESTGETKTHAQKKVSFTEVDKVPQTEPTRTKEGQNVTIPTASNPIDSSVFTGNIVEKQQRKSTTQSASKGKPKRKSRFSQERQEGLR